MGKITKKQLKGKSFGRKDRMRCYLFTINNPTVGQEEYLKNPDKKLVNYMIWQHEVGEKGTEHIQGYVELKKQMRYNAVKKLKGFNKAHLEERRGTVQQAIDYCSKTGEGGRIKGTDLFEFGTPSRGGSNVTLIEMITEGKSLKEISVAHPQQFIRQHAGIQKLREMNQKPRKFKPIVYIFYGKTGTGKSFKANKTWPEAYRVMWPKGGRWWWDGYDHQETVILDEFRHQVKYDKMLRLLDRYEMKVEYKGGVTEFNSKRIVITTNIDPAEWYPNVRDRAPLIRRINEFAKIYEFCEKNKPPKRVKAKRIHAEGIPLPEVQENTRQGGWSGGGETIRHPRPSYDIYDSDKNYW